MIRRNRLHLLSGTTEGKVSGGAQLVHAARFRHLHGDVFTLPTCRDLGIADGHDGALAFPIQALVRISKQEQCHCHPCTSCNNLKDAANRSQSTAFSPRAPLWKRALIRESTLRQFVRRQDAKSVAVCLVLAHCHAT